MAVLIQDDAQLKALEEINQMLEELRAITTRQSRARARISCV